MDLSNLDTSALAEAGAELLLTHPDTGEPLLDEATGESVTITVLGKDSKSYRQKSHELSSRQLNKRIGAAQNGQGKIKINTVELDNNVLELLAFSTREWKHIQVGKQELPCTFDNAKMLYTRFPWIREQVDAFVADRANYLGNSRSASLPTPVRS